ncbi:MAG: hypothetical protein V6D39_01260, partial [Dolichospermum lemmermannii FEM_B0920]
LGTLSTPLAEITKTRYIIDKILNNNENKPPIIENVLFCQNPIQITYILITRSPTSLINVVIYQYLI